MADGFTRNLARALPLVSQALHLLLGVGECCRFQPTCSDYGKRALEAHGLVRGSWLTGKRLLRCGPAGGFGLDPVPPKSF